MGYLLFVWTTSGYELREHDGDIPDVGAEITDDGRTFEVVKIGPSPLPGDKRVCAYLAG